MMRLAVAAFVLAACGGDVGQGTPDAPVQMDAPPANVVALSSCPAVVDATVMDSATAFIPKDTTIPRTGVVKFALTAEHFVVPNTLGNTDQALMVPFGGTRCFQFNGAGTYGFACGAHGFTGTVTVQ